jgi:sulfur carrier protein
MSVTVNGRAQELPQERTLAALLALVAPSGPFAVARNGDFVPRDLYENCELHTGDEIEIVQPAAGGCVGE